MVWRFHFALQIPITLLFLYKFMSDPTSLAINENIWSALFLTTVSGLSTSIGGLIVLLYGSRSVSQEALGHMLSFSSGVMLFISFSDLLPEAISEIGYFSANLYFFLGMLFFSIGKYVNLLGSSRSLYFQLCKSLHNLRTYECVLQFITWILHNTSLRS
jgi:zinc transporter ZupT